MDFYQACNCLQLQQNQSDLFVSIMEKDYSGVMEIHSPLWRPLTYVKGVQSKKLRKTS
jgi:hypothetical protein